MPVPDGVQGGGRTPLGLVVAIFGHAEIKYLGQVHGGAAGFRPVRSGCGS
jgi:hypothetical protein